MYDPLTNRFRLTCPDTGHGVDAPLSSFRTLERLAGAQHPAIYRVTFDCHRCGGEHAGLIAEHDLDVEALEPAGEQTFVNLQTGVVRPLREELADLAQRHLRAGRWPWSFYCAAEHRMRPGYPSHLRLLSPTGDPGLVGVAVRCASCAATSVNLVSAAHLDRPFFHDPIVRYVDHTFDGRLETAERFRDALRSSRFDEERNRFAA